MNRVYVGVDAARNFRAGSSVRVGGEPAWLERIEDGSLVLTRPWWLRLAMARELVRGRWFRLRRRLGLL